jgi:hypothetical protein
VRLFLTDTFSKKADNLADSIGIDFMHRNFARKHMTLKTTSARAIGIETEPGPFAIS